MPAPKRYGSQTLAYPERIETRMYRLSMVNPPFGRPYYGWRPPTNVFETEAGVVVQVEVAGLGRGDFRVELGEGRLTIAGVRRVPGSLSGCLACHQVEIAGGRFRTEVEMPWPVDGDAIEADYRDGFIFVTLPRRRA
jgi:HSP20 family molecular chaperone IbpA